MIQRNSNVNKGISLSNKDREFINMVNNRITMYGQIPYTIPEPLIVDVIKSCAKYFYKYYSNALHQSFYVVDVNDIRKYVGGASNFQYHAIKVDPRIRNIFEVNEANSTLNSYKHQDGDRYSTTSIAGSNLNRTELIGIDNNLYMLEHMVKMVEQRALDNMTTAKVPIAFSYETNEVLFKRMPTSQTLVMRVMVCNKIEDLYNDTWFERYVIACCKRELKRLLGSHTVELAGGGTMNVDEICNTEDIEIVHEVIKNSSGIGDIILKRN